MLNSSQSLEILSTLALDLTKEEIIDDIIIKRFKYFYPYFPMNMHRKVLLDKKGGNPISISVLKYLLKNDFDIFHCHTMGHLGNTVHLASKIKSETNLMIGASLSDVSPSSSTFSSNEFSGVSESSIFFRKESTFSSSDPK